MNPFPREPLSDILDRELPVADVLRRVEVPLGDWLTINEANVRAGAAIVEPEFEKHLLAARKVGSRRGRGRGLVLGGLITLAVTAVWVAVLGIRLGWLG